ncbi:MAG: hypothetical protein H6555_13020 [Lewinellaceae bacterium]|nr:hypothetical protein [Lewinellaceae bacterium]
MLIYIALLVNLACSADSPAPDSATPQGRILLTDSLFQAGILTSIYARADTARADKSWLLIWSDALGDTPVTGSWRNDTLVFSIPRNLCSHSGRVQLSLTSGGQVADQRFLQLTPAAPEGVVETYVGPKTITVSSGQRAMVVAIPKDAFGNPVATGTVVTFSLRYPGQSIVTRESLMDNLVSSILIPAEERKGQILVGATAGKASSVEEGIALTPAWPGQVSLEVESWVPFADPRQYVAVRTNPIVDALGNLVADGTLVQIVVREQEQVVGSYPGFTSNGVAQVHLQNPNHPADWEITAFANGKAEGPALRLGFVPYVVALAVTYLDEEKTLRIGPVKAPLGQLVTDDFPMEVTLQQQDQHYHFSVLTQDGFCSLSLPADFPAGIYRCSVMAGGQRISREIYIR